MPRVSIIVPAHNAEQTIVETICSVQAQTFSDFELIVIDDGSTDRTLERLEAAGDSRLRILSYENAGAPLARNRGIAETEAECILLLDADDRWHTDKIRRLYCRQLVDRFVAEPRRGNFPPAASSGP